jgi:hypothetical protein
MTNDQLPITNDPLPITHYPLPITHYPLPITNDPLPIPNYPLPMTHYPLPILSKLEQNLAKRLKDKNHELKTFCDDAVKAIAIRQLIGVAESRYWLQIPDLCNQIEPSHQGFNQEVGEQRKAVFSYLRSATPVNL